MKELVWVQCAGEAEGKRPVAGPIVAFVPGWFVGFCRVVAETRLDIATHFIG